MGEFETQGLIVAKSSRADDTPFAQWLANVWDEEIEPIYARHHWELMLKHLEMPEKPQVLVAGCSTGAVIPAVMRHMRPDDQGRVIALEARGPLLAKARARVEDCDRRRVFLRGDSMRKLKFAAEVFDVVASSLSWFDLPEPGVALQEFHRVLTRNGRVVLALPLKGTLEEVYDLFAEVALKFELPEVHRKLEELMRRRHPDMESAQRLLKGVGFTDVTVDSEEKEMSFPAGGNFFTSTLVRALFESRWRAAASPHDEKLFKYTRQAIDTYFGSECFQVRLVVGCICGRKLG